MSDNGVYILHYPKILSSLNNNTKIPQNKRGFWVVERGGVEPREPG